MTFIGPSVHQALAGPVAPPCALIVDWLKKKDRVAKVALGLDEKGISSAYILLSSLQNSDDGDILSLADIVLGLKPKLVLIHLSSFFNQMKGRDNVSMAKFLTLVEANRDASYLPKFVVYSRAALRTGDIGEWMDAPNDTFADRVSLLHVRGGSDKEDAEVILKSIGSLGKQECSASE
ncbi:hypothetical protein [Devosia sp.]|uniref:hypothetical protein n=1 Tax=Devosia sp. TaxID=1871048 RepID=UPI0032677913